MEPVTKACPGLRDALFLLAKARYLAGDIKAAMSTLQHVVDNLDPTLAEAHLLMAQIQLHQVRNCTYMNVRPAENKNKSFLQCNTNNYDVGCSIAHFRPTT